MCDLRFDDDPLVPVPENELDAEHIDKLECISLGACAIDDWGLKTASDAKWKVDGRQPDPLNAMERIRREIEDHFGDIHKRLVWLEDPDRAANQIQAVQDLEDMRETIKRLGDISRAHDARITELEAAAKVLENLLLRHSETIAAL